MPKTECEALLAEPQNREMGNLELTWSELIAHEGGETGREEGKRELLLGLLVRRFGPLPEATDWRVQTIHSVARLSALGMEVLEAEIWRTSIFSIELRLR